VPTAIISDVHANAPALKVVLADIAARGISRIICLGDTVGYGPDPLECVDLVAKACEWSLMGNHDYGVLYEPTNFNAAAESAAFWTRQQFDLEPDDALRAKRYDFLNKLRVRVVERVGPNGAEPLNGTANGVKPGHHLLAVHGSPRRPINEYIFPDDAINATDKLESIFDRITKLAIVGHTHVPGVFTNEPDFYPPSELGENGYKFQEDEKAIINVGSVGQPRDFDPRASYVILHPTHAQFVRLEYDVKATAEKIKSIPELGGWLGDRLYEGR
jgi:diadenosine tetraphosphatase ApaH/serine/threonine PP2A family protein phosphatase